MKRLDLPDVSLAFSDEGSPDGPAVVLAHSLGTNMDLWAEVAALLAPTHRVLRYDLRGHGNSTVPKGPYTLGRLTRDAEVMAERVGPCVLAGCSVGSQIGIALAEKRPDLVRGLVLSCSAVKIGTPDIWQDRINVVKAGGTGAIAAANVERWYGGKAAGNPVAEVWQRCVEATDDEGYVGVAAAVASTDLITIASGLRLPVEVVAGARDAATPPDLVREMAELIPRAQFHLLRDAGHLAPADAPDEMAAIIANLTSRIDLHRAHDHQDGHHHH